MGFSRGSLTLPRMNAHRLVIIAAAFTIAVAAALATALVTFSSQALPRAVRHDLSRATGTSFVINGNVNASQGADAVIHLAGIPGEASLERICELNIGGSYVAFEAARRAGTPRVIFASSNHAVGFTPRSDFPVPDYAFPKPDTYYGVSKAAIEALAAMYHERYGMDAICLRILSCFPKPLNVRMLSSWLSPGDAGRLFEACLTAERPGFRVAFGVSANTRGGWVSLAEAEALGYQPEDDAEAYAAEIIAEHGQPDPDDPVLRRLGGEFTLPYDQIPHR